jgi:serine/threonine-protein kinase
MTPAMDYARKQVLLQALTPLPDEARAALLDRECASAPELRFELLALLEQQTTRAASAPADRESPLIGKTVDRYRILRLIGEGGMGAVFLAERSDFSLKVALKLIRGATPALVQRFERERRILAAMHHPGIAQLFDGGNTDDGTPYLAMEHVDGAPITRYAAERRLPVEGRLALFAKVCDAIAYAHQNLVIHRDIKPSNVLVDGQGQPKLLDFGIAALQESAEGEALTTSAAMTPAYASPEQLAGQRLSAATDQYSLGVLLYELLTGSRPFARPATGAMATARGTPMRPSQAVTRQGLRTTEPPPTEPRRLRAQLAGDIDAIVLKALRPEPEQRYPTVGDLAADIRRTLAHEPVSAQPPSRGYVLRKFLARHRLEAAAAAMLVLGLAAAAAFAWYSWLEQRAAYARARSSAEEAAAINDFLVSMMAAPDPRVSGKDVRVVDVLAREAAAAPDAFKDRPLVRARLLQTLGHSYSGLGLPNQATPLLMQAVDIYRQTFGADAVETLTAENEVLESRFDVDPPDPFLAKVEEFYQRVCKVLPETHPLALTALNNYGTATLLAYDGGRRELLGQARDLLAKNLHLRTQVYGEGDERTSHARNNFANLESRAGNTAKAEQLFRDNLRWQLKLYGPDNFYPLDTQANLAGALADLGRNQEALDLLDQALAGMGRVLGAEHPRTLESFMSKAKVLAKMGRKDEALKIAQQVQSVSGQRSEDADVLADALAFQKKLAADKT